jgi:hypothetical protein
MVEQVVSCSKFLNKHLTLNLLEFLSANGIADTVQK